MIIGVDHGYSAMKTAHICFPSGIVRYEHEPYTNRGVLRIEGKYYVCGTGRQPLLRTKTENEQYYLLTLAAIAQEIRFRKAPRKAEVVLAAGLPLTSFGREKKNFRDYLLERKNPLVFEYEGEIYEIRVLDVRLFPQGYSVVAMHPEIIRDEPSVLLVDIGGWTIDIMRLDNGVPNAATCRSLEMGVIRCQDEILEQVRRDTGLSITEVQVERVLNGKSCSISEEAKNIILTYGKQYVKRIVSAIMEAGFDLQAVPSYIRFMNWGIMWNGKCLTARISESLSPEKECILSDILMKDVPEKYYLSPEQTRRLLFKSSQAAKGAEFIPKTD